MLRHTFSYGLLALSFSLGTWCLLSTSALGTNTPADTNVDPGSEGSPPSDAVILFDGTDLSKWCTASGGEPHWKVEDGVLVATSGGDLYTREGFGDIQFHVEWATPAKGGSNSGIKFHAAYEIQIIDSYGSDQLSKGQAGAVYKQHAPLVNACRKPGEWQTYDILFRAPRYGDDGKLLRHGRFTVFHNGVLIHDNVKILGRTNSTRPVPPDYRQPLFLQYHGAPVRFRNVWLRELPPREEE